MGDKIGVQIAGFISAILGVAIIAVLLSQGATTVSVLSTFFSGLSQLLGVVISPVTGGSNFAGGASTYAGEINLGSGVSSGTASGSGLSANGLGLGVGIAGLGSLSVSNGAINSIANLFGGSSSSSSGLAGGSWDSGISDVGDLVGGTF